MLVQVAHRNGDGSADTLACGHTINTRYLQPCKLYRRCKECELKSWLPSTLSEQAEILKHVLRKKGEHKCQYEKRGVICGRPELWRGEVILKTDMTGTPTTATQWRCKKHKPTKAQLEAQAKFLQHHLPSTPPSDPPASTSTPAPAPPDGTASPASSDASKSTS